VTAPFPEPPDPEELIARAQERAREAQERIEQHLLAAHEAWGPTTEWELGFGNPDVEDVVETLEHFGDATPQQGEKLFGSLLRIGPYEAMPYDDLGSAEEFHLRRSEEHLENLSPQNLGQAAARVAFDPRYGGQSFDDPLVRKDPENRGLVSSAVTRDPAPISYSPTSSLNPSRPRTVAAGYDVERRVLTVVFRDGTLYNYYGVGRNEWNGFVKNHSKGRFIKKYLDNKVRGYADMTSVPQVHRDLMYKAARTSQVFQKGYTGKQTRIGRIRQEQRYSKANPGAKRYTSMRGNKTYKQ
jgi:hypothetical protein